MRSKPIYVNALLCERALLEIDGVLSAIRLVDIFYIDPNAKISPEDRPVGVQLFFAAKFAPEDEDEHVVEIYLERPSENPIKIAETEPQKATGRFPLAPKGINVTVRFGVIPKALGLHYLTFALDGEQVARVPFTLQPTPAETQPPPVYTQAE